LKGIRKKALGFRTGKSIKKDSLIFKLFLVFIPKAQEEGAQASAEGKPFHVQFLRFSVALGKVVVGDTGRHVMGVMESDVSGGPLKDRRELEARGTPQGGRQMVPLFLAGEIGARKIMLKAASPF
jgi:hypothetical protein